MSINIITAINETNSIGKNGHLLYRAKKDLQRFKQLTQNNSGHPNICLMGKRTFEELPMPLDKRVNVVLTSNKNYKAPKGVIVESSFDKVLNHYLNSGSQDKDLWICGGQKLFEQALPYADKVYITYIHDNKKGDTFFPYEKVKRQFKIIHKEEHEENGLEFEFIDYVRKDDSNN
ncbi:dihydrofolate reductase [Lysinibacillus sp. NPDC086135]|uniref:dihydrofolate reductase n=1 Tax=Lysinibacillus sp. NPDC086135 TaxID=3364130 RepID=UPI00380D03B0